MTNTAQFKEILNNEDVICQLGEYVKLESRMQEYHAREQQKQADYCNNQLTQIEFALSAITGLEMFQVAELINQYTGGE